MNGFQLNHRELELARILKAQEAKIAELEGKLAEGGNLEKLRLEASLKEVTLKYQQKEKEVLQMKEQQNRYRHDLRQSREQMRNSRLQEQNTIQAENKSLQSENKLLQAKVRELQDRIKSDTERIDSDYTRAMRTNQSLQKEVAHYKHSIASIELEIEKLQIFYRSALVELPKRVDTIQWVDNFIKFMGQYEQNLQKHPFEVGFEKFEKEMLEFKREFSTRVKDYSDSCHQRQQELLKAKQQIGALVAKCAKESKEALAENQQFWEAVKKERASKVTELERKHEQQLASCREQSKKELEHLQSRVRQLEQQKKQLTLAFQELKSYYSAKEKSHTEEVRLMKQTNDKLIELGEKRQESFQSEVSKLSGEVGELSRKYQENIRLPFEQFNRRFTADLRNAVSEITTFPYKERCGNLLTRMETRCRDTENLIRKLSQRQSGSQDTMERHLEHIDSLGKNLEKNIRFIIEAVDRYGLDGSPGTDFLEDEITLEPRVNRLEIEQLEQRKDYEISLLKRNNTKLQELNSKLQQLFERQAREPSLAGKQANNPAENGSVANTTIISGKLDQAESELQLLRQSHSRYQVKFQQDLRRLRFAKYDRQIVSVIAQNLSKYQSSVRELHDYCHTVILPTMLAQNQHATQYILDVKTSIRETQEFIEQPVKRLKEVIKMQQSVKIVPPLDPSALTIKSTEVLVSSNFKEEIRLYREILADREKAKQTVTKMLTELVQHLRSALPPKESLTPSKQTEQLARKPKQDGAVQRRIKQVQQARLKDKNQLAAALQKLSKTVRKAQSATSRADHTLEVLGRTEQHLKEKVQYMIGLLEYPLKGRNISSEFNQITKKAMNDLESKLKQSVCENQGLLRELKVATNFNRAFREPRKEDSQPS